MENTKNKAPKGVIIAILAIIVMIMVYLILTFIFPELFQNMNTGDQMPIQPK